MLLLKVQVKHVRLQTECLFQVKTGTTSSAYDLWFCGYTPYLTASIWTGYDENKELGSDQAYHERLWSKIMSQIDQVKGYKIKDFE